MSKLNKELKEFYSSISKNRYKILTSKYVFDRWIFQFFMYSIFLILFLFVYEHNFELDFYICGAEPGEFCKNPFYKPLTWKNLPEVPPGEYGTNFKTSINFLSYLSLGLFILSFIINHFAHNKNFELLKKLERLNKGVK